MSQNRDPAWLSRLDRDANAGVTHSMSGFAAGCLAAEYRKLIAEVKRLRLYERAMQSMAAQLIHPTMAAKELAESQLEDTNA